MNDFNPCPFCGAGETQVRPSYMWTGMRNQLICVRIRHWCEKPSRTTIEVTGNTEAEAVAAWNTRAAAEIARAADAGGKEGHE